MKVYACVSIGGGDQKNETHSPVDRHGRTNPAWNFMMKYMVGEAGVKHHGATLVIKLYCKGKLGDRYIGEVHLTVKDLYEYAYSCGGIAVVNYPVQRGCVNSQGFLKFSYSSSPSLLTVLLAAVPLNGALAAVPLNGALTAVPLTVLLAIPLTPGHLPLTLSIPLKNFLSCEDLLKCDPISAEIKKTVLIQFAECMQTDSVCIAFQFCSSANCISLQHCKLHQFAGEKMPWIRLRKQILKDKMERAMARLLRTTNSFKFSGSIKGDEFVELVMFFTGVLYLPHSKGSLLINGEEVWTS
ncbi:hypothetical protein LguiB_009898 [Lonicera macranthoides]